MTAFVWRAVVVILINFSTKARNARNQAYYDGFQCPVGLWGLFYLWLLIGIVGFLFLFQCPVGLWGLFYYRGNFCS